MKEGRGRGGRGPIQWHLENPHENPHELAFEKRACTNSNFWNFLMYLFDGKLVRIFFKIFMMLLNLAPVLSERRAAFSSLATCADVEPDRKE